MSVKSKQIVPNPVRPLPPEVARKIAAGEVIDRPQAILRELLDNAIDSGAENIVVEVDGGGIDKIRVADDGIGMTKEDLEQCANPHVTSKIASEMDLLNLSTLGFRGEALASIAAVSRLEIISMRQGQPHAWKMEAYLTKEHTLSPASLSQGTVVQSQSLFENFPARRIFLKRPSNEGILCRQIFVEKALSNPKISFRLFMDGKLKLDFPKTQSLYQRVALALDMEKEIKLFSEIHDTQEDFSFTIVLGEPGLSRTDKKNIGIYVNGRKIQEYGLIQAIEYGATGYFPNGTHPIAFLFLEIDPKLVDFNIHPAKKEVRFKDLTPIHKAVSSSIRNFYRNYTLSTMNSSSTTETSQQLFDDDIEHIKNKFFLERPHTVAHFDSDAIMQEENPFYNHREAPAEKTTFIAEKTYHPHNSLGFSSSSFETNFQKKEWTSPAKEIKTPFEESEIPSFTQEPLDFTYIGQSLGVFLIVEKENTLYFIDQHAAHERILFNQFIENQGKSQNLLFPLVIETANTEEDDFLLSIQEKLKEIGFDIKNCNEGRWEVYSTPQLWTGTENDLQRDILTLKTSPEEIIRNIAATCACRKAVKDGDILDRHTALSILKATFALPDPHCPHGRPVWTTVDKEALFAKIKRT